MTATAISATPTAGGAKLPRVSTRMTPEQRITNMQARVLHDAWLDGSHLYWARRAAQLEAARPRRGDFTGLATPAEVSATWDRLTAAAQACRHRADVEDSTLGELLDTLASLSTGAAA